VRSKKLYVPLGAGAEEAEDFEGMWVTLMKSQTASQHIMKCISRLIVTIINNEGRDLRPTDVMLCVAILSAAVDVGKGTRPRDLTRPLAWPLPHALFTAARLARVCTVKPTELLDAESASEEEEEEESEEEEEDEEGLSAPESKSEAKARLKAKLEAKLEAEKEKRKRACVKRWQEEMTPAEKDAYVKAFLMPNQPIELKVRRQRAHTHAVHTAALGRHPQPLTRCCAASRDAGSRHDAEGAHTLPLPHAQGEAARGRPGARAVHLRRRGRRDRLRAVQGGARGLREPRAQVASHVQAPLRPRRAGRAVLPLLEGGGGRRGAHAVHGVRRRRRERVRDRGALLVAARRVARALAAAPPTAPAASRAHAPAASRRLLQPPGMLTGVLRPAMLAPRTLPRRLAEHTLAPRLGSQTTSRPTSSPSSRSWPARSRA
jgi:hypothetical protein